MKRKASKLLALLVALVMVLSSLPMTVMADVPPAPSAPPLCSAVASPAGAAFNYCGACPVARAVPASSPAGSFYWMWSPAANSGAGAWVAARCPNSGTANCASWIGCPEHSAELNLSITKELRVPANTQVPAVNFYFDFEFVGHHVNPDTPVYGNPPSGNIPSIQTAVITIPATAASSTPQTITGSVADVLPTTGWLDSGVFVFRVTEREGTTQGQVGNLLSTYYDDSSFYIHVYVMMDGGNPVLRGVVSHVEAQRPLFAANCQIQDLREPDCDCEIEKDDILFDNIMVIIDTTTPPPTTTDTDGSTPPPATTAPITTWQPPTTADEYGSTPPPHTTVPVPTTTADEYGSTPPPVSTTPAPLTTPPPATTPPPTTTDVDGSTPPPTPPVTTPPPNTFPTDPAERDPSLTISKTVTGDMGDMYAYFAFRAQLQLPPLMAETSGGFPDYVVARIYCEATNTHVLNPLNFPNPLPGMWTVDVDTGRIFIPVGQMGEVSMDFFLRHGQTLEFLALPVGTDYIITEAGVNRYVQSADITINNILNPIPNPDFPLTPGAPPFIPGTPQFGPVASNSTDDLVLPGFVGGTLTLVTAGTPAVPGTPGTCLAVYGLCVCVAPATPATPYIPATPPVMEWTGVNSVDVENRNEARPPMGVFMDNLPFIGLIALSIGGLAVFLVLKTRASKRYATAYQS